MKKLSIPTTTAEITLGWIYYAIQLLVLPEVIVLCLLLLGLDTSSFVLNFIYFCVNFAVFGLIFHKFLWKSLKKACSIKKKCLKYAGLGFLIYWILNIVVFSLIIKIYPGYANLNNEAVGTMAQDHFGAIAVATVLLAPLAEELVFRGLIFQGLYNRSRFLAYVISAFAFSVIHLIGYLGSMDLTHMILSFIQYLPAGLALGWVYGKTDTICTPILMHMLVNLFGIFAVR